MTDDLQAALRQISGTVGALDATVKHMVATWQSQEAGASAGRRVLHAKVDALRDQVSTMAGTLNGVLKDVAEMKPVTDGVKVLKAEARGAGKLGRGLWLVAGFVVSALAWISSNWISLGWKGKP